MIQKEGGVRSPIILPRQVWLKSCPRCLNGDMLPYGPDTIKCIQCGYRNERIPLWDSE